MLRVRAGAEGPRRAADGASKAARRASTRDGTTPWAHPCPGRPRLRREAGSSLEERGRELGRIDSGCARFSTTPAGVVPGPGPASEPAWAVPGAPISSAPQRGPSPPTLSPPAASAGTPTRAPDGFESRRGHFNRGRKLLRSQRFPAPVFSGSFASPECLQAGDASRPSSSIWMARCFSPSSVRMSVQGESLQERWARRCPHDSSGAERALQ